MTKSIAANHFPKIVWRDGKKQLWNPIHRKALKNRPEERVRLRIIEYLIRGGWSKHRISTEEALSSQNEKTPLRTDIICYTQQFDPFLLVECKAEQIKITEQTATQIARYNQNIGAPFLLMTNGVQDFWFRIKDRDNVQRLEDIPQDLPKREVTLEQPLSYWKARGFAGEKAAPPLRSWLEKALNTNLLPQDIASRFLSFKNSPSDLDLNNYYAVHSFTDFRLALTFTSTPFGGSRLVGIINRNGKNTAVLEINLDLLFDKRTPNASVYTSAGTQNIDVRNYDSWNHHALEKKPLPQQLDALVAELTP